MTGYSDVPLIVTLLTFPKVVAVSEEVCKSTIDSDRGFERLKFLFEPLTVASRPPRSILRVRHLGISQRLHG